ncbi:hypothetical protein [Paenibacillus massiliensis]|uniref:hypothetical protein n=1 Tax=Paenibacillus massiliensis TaxID=225917 RepID=UPI0003F95B67|nr:hypothetical protein [Paenibacillus massiliensis]
MSERTYKLLDGSELICTEEGVLFHRLKSGFKAITTDPNNKYMELLSLIDSLQEKLTAGEKREKWWAERDEVKTVELGELNRQLRVKEQELEEVKRGTSIMENYLHEFMHETSNIVTQRQIMNVLIEAVGREKLFGGIIHE